MFIISLLADPEKRNLDSERVADAMRQLGLEHFRWLSEGVAAEFRSVAIPHNFEELRSGFDEFGFDLNAMPAANRRKKILLADMDSTMIGQECIDELADIAGVGERVADITARAMNGEIGFKSALRFRVELLAGLDEQIVESVWRERISINPGARELVATMRSNGAYAAIVSGGFTVFAERVASEAGFDEYKANELISKNGRLAGHVADPILGKDAKASFLAATCARLETDTCEAIAVGDGANDLSMLKMAGIGVAYKAKPAVAAQCGIRINNCDLTALLYLQGYSESEFVTTASSFG
ncbi:MAG: phosphoserine phosphatase SerB [Albidovulum sp.]|nr:phosphoserine phosphatase SerB [Albidovulum sp.]